ncbi:TetR/AcrR family transcriptional regulator [Mycolicibacterium porcinum]|uniref:TetR/AcrR family transcriptional regulator n=1 Tax=Mycolicibacterium porcinum TaxID=39693 RepID=A0AAW5SYI1_9MYCO|nr:TetR/AcrR family transcriptional regulator [Mycolicibacterium porcinum]MCV7386985.1 TetR/AcrR family transcriptional regulator [Mycolicibacterium porcinum]ORB42436.1 transposase [Mycolicibacterium porcinum]TVX95694.1 TetR/AcrR family transcriptional regulator [Mycolicibacterium porcinum]CDO32155.1 transcriptional regulator [Mycolicibacterium vulneris]
MPGPRTQAERTRATIDQILVVARERFAADGYDNTFVDNVAERAGMTKGALYHHFEGKRGLFAAVFENEQRAIGEAVNRAARGTKDSWQRFLRGCRGFFDAVLDPGVQRITLIDAPAVLGWEAMRDLEDEHVTSLLRLGLAQVIADGHLPEQRVEPLAHLLHGAMCEAAMTVARSSDPERESRDSMAALERLLNGIAAHDR